MRVNLMVDGQESVTWPQWRNLALAVESAGLEGLFRSDHYQSVVGRTERSSLDAWTTIAALGTLTERIRLGTLVSPTSFRHPSVLAKSVVTANHASDGRVELGLGAGWHELEHTTPGFPFHDVGTRFDVFEEQLEIVLRQFREERFDSPGTTTGWRAARPRPKPVQDPLHELQDEDGDVDEWLDRMRAAWVVGTVEQAAEQLADLGVQRVMLQHLAHDDLDMVALPGRLVA